MPTNKVWLITGCSTGFGRLLAEELLRREHTAVVATARSVDTIQDLGASAPSRCLSLPLDVTRPAQVSAAVEGALAHFGKIDVVVNNAGYGVIGAVEEVSDGELRAMFEVNVFGVVNVLNAVLPSMRAQGSGHIVNISSTAGLLAFPGSATYAATKHALEALSEGLYHELLPLGIRVSLIEPGPFRTDFAGRSIVMATRRISDYDQTAGRRRDTIREFDRNQAGDPQKGVEAIISHVEADSGALRLALGDMAYDQIRKKLEWVAKDLDEGEPIGLPTDYPVES